MAFSHFLRGLLLAAALAGTARPGGVADPDILILGDSQLSFGAGPAFVDFFDSMAGQCGLGQGWQTGVIGVRSSAPQGWTAEGGAGRDAICKIDPQWKVNAASYGILNMGKNPYIQIGQRDGYRFCTEGQPPLGVALGDEGYTPDLLVLFFLGNAADRWAASPEDARADAARLSQVLPPGLPCVFVTTAPPYGARDVALRRLAQDTFAEALAETGQRCTFVPGLVDDTIAANEGNPRHFRRKKNGKVKDRFHPNEAAQRVFLDLRRPALCAAIRAALTPDAVTKTRAQ